MKRLIGITGHARHGKDTVGGVLVNEFGYKRYSFADQVREMAYRINPIVEKFAFPKHPVRLGTYVDLLGWEKAKDRGETRQFLIELGMSVRDIISEDAWVGALAKKAGLYQPGAHMPIVITDVRFINEATWIHRLGGEVWRVTRRSPAGELFDGGVPLDDRSEREVPQMYADVEIENSGTLEDLYAEVRHVRWVGRVRGRVG